MASSCMQSCCCSLSAWLPLSTGMHTPPFDACVHWETGGTCEKLKLRSQFTFENEADECLLHFQMFAHVGRRQWFSVHCKAQCLRGCVHTCKHIQFTAEVTIALPSRTHQCNQVWQLSSAYIALAYNGDERSCPDGYICMSCSRG